ncbi:MAG: chromosomal replication initiator protein DnaA [Calothrix sp. C42_A2020_038]|nr:chromosomal replication initiator protein DnaA [Calothrix sp. C42_A2020_038]
MSIPIENLWSQVLARLQLELSRPTFETWIKTASAEKLEANCLVIRTPNPFARNWLQKYYIKKIANVVCDIAGYPIEIHIVAGSNDDSHSQSENELTWEQPITNTMAEVVTRNSPKTSDLNSKYLFSRFVVGANNRMAHAAALAVAESPGREFNPLFLCGGVGLGKTHLMQAIGHYRLDISRDSKIFYVSTEKFINDFITAISQGMQSFREHYRTADVLLVDDIQFIEGKEGFQEEFFHTFNTLHEAGKQVVIASDRPPKHIPQLQERLCSRFSMGLIADIQTPDLETRMAILQKKAEYENIRLPRDVIEYIASNYTNNIRELEGALIRALAYISIWGLPMTVENITPVLEVPREKIAATPEAILATISDAFGVSIEDMKGNSRRREISWARQIGMYLMRQCTDLSLPRIGEEFGGKDHTTVLYSCEKITQMLRKDASLKQTLNQLTDRIQINNPQTLW